MVIDQELREQIASELFDIWQEAKRGSHDNKDDQTFEALPKKHKDEYYLTVARILSDVEKTGYRKVPSGEPDQELREKLFDLVSDPPCHQGENLCRFWDRGYGDFCFLRECSLANVFDCTLLDQILALIETQGYRKVIGGRPL